MDPEPHLDAEAIARLVDGSSPSPAADRHLEACRLCFAAYADAVRVRSAELLGEPLAPAPAHLRRMGRSLADSPGVEVGAVALARSPRRRPARWRARPAVAVPVVSALLVGLVLVLTRDAWWPQPAEPLPSAVLAPLMAAAERQSQLGLVFPDANLLAEEVTVYRAGRTLSSPSLDSAVDALVRRYETGDRSPDVVYWLAAAHVLSARHEDAALLLDPARALHPGDERLAALHAILAYRTSRLDTAESILRSLHESDRSNPVWALNLALVLATHAENAEARVLLEELARDYETRPLGQRARRELERSTAAP